MRVIVFLGLLAAFFPAGEIRAENWVPVPENVLMIAMGPLTFSSEKRQYLIEFEISEDQFRDCQKTCFYVGIRSLVKDAGFMCRYSVNGHSIGGAGAGDQWHIGGAGISTKYLNVGTNRVLLTAEERKDIPKNTFSGQAGGVVLYLSNDSSEDIGLLDRIPYGEPKVFKPVPDPEEETGEKDSFWITGLIHEHSTNSDGSPSLEQRVKQAKGLGYSFIICSDHYEQIDQPIKAPGLYYKWVTQPIKRVVGFGQYVKSCRDASKDGSFVAIAGAEITTPWHLTSEIVSYSHTLCLGNIGKTSALDAVSGKEGKQTEAIASVNELSFSVAAHPNLTSLASVSIQPWEGTHFRYDYRSKDKYAGLNGIEIGNTVSPSQDDLDMAFFMKLMKEHQPVFPTGGCDSHGWGEKDDDKRLKRITGLFVEELTEAGILQAIGRGAVYASTDGIGIKTCRPAPNFSLQTVLKGRFSFTLTGLPQRVICQMYRDGEPIASSKKVVSPESPVYTWDDNGLTEEESWYNFRVLPNYLITAPIVLRSGLQ